MLFRKWSHWGCLKPETVTLLKTSYGSADDIPGHGELKDGEKEKVTRAWDEGEIPEDDQGPGEAVEGLAKKAPAKRKPKDDGDDGAAPKKRARKAKVRAATPLHRGQRSRF